MKRTQRGKKEGHRETEGGVSRRGETKEEKRWKKEKNKGKKKKTWWGAPNASLQKKRREKKESTLQTTLTTWEFHGDVKKENGGKAPKINTV